MTDQARFRRRSARRDRVLVGASHVNCLRLQSAAEEVAALVDGRAVGALGPRLPWASWAPFGFVPLAQGRLGVHGFFAAEGGGSTDPLTWPVAWWDLARGQLAPVAGSLEAHLAALRIARPADASRDQLEALVASDRGACAALVALAGLALDDGDRDVARGLLKRAVVAAPWWMAPHLLLLGMARTEGDVEAAGRHATAALRARWDATGAGRHGLVPRLGREPRGTLRSLVSFLVDSDERALGLCFDPAWRPLREASDPLAPGVQEIVARELERTERLEEAAQRWEWLALGHGWQVGARRAESAYGRLGWPLHERHATRLLTRVASW